MTDFTEQLQLNDIDFGIYIEDVLTRIMYGEHVDDTFLPCGYVPRYKEEHIRIVLKNNKSAIFPKSACRVTH